MIDKESKKFKKDIDLSGKQSTKKKPEFNIDETTTRKRNKFNRK